MNKKLVIVSLILLLVVGVLLFIFSGNLTKVFFKPKPTNNEIGVTLNSANLNTQTPNGKKESPQKQVEVVATNLNVPWELSFLPNENILVTERSGNLVILNSNFNQIAKIQVNDVYQIGEGGLLGLEVDKNFNENNYIYLYLTYRQVDEIKNKVVRYSLVNNQLTNPVVVVNNIPGSRFHNGGRILINENYLYVTTGDAQNVNLPQNPNSLAGKILQVDLNNNFSTKVYSIGHRNPQGLVFDNNSNLWSTEHGPSGGQSGFDELNKITLNANYGWPQFVGDEGDNITKPALHSGSSDTWAPSDMFYLNDSIFFVGLRGSALYQYKINSGELIEHFKNDFGRIRVANLHNNYVYLATSNTDGRGSVNEGDDKIIKISTELLN